MNRNGKYFVSPADTGENFKSLITRLAASGAGRPIDVNGFPEGIWTPHLLATAIAQFEGNEDGIELRTVQLWFQSNSRGVSSENVRWLARIFGCDDPIATSEWQTILTMSLNRLAQERRIGRAQSKKSLPRPEKVDDPRVAKPDLVVKNPSPSLSIRTERMISNSDAMAQVMIVWGGISALWFIAYALGIHSVTYEVASGLQKEVGLFWSPAWSVGDFVILPVFLILVAQAVNYWKYEGRAQVIGEPIDTASRGWHHTVFSQNISFKVALFVSIGVVFLLQWLGAYLSPILSASPDQTAPNWLLITLVRPDVLSPTAAIVVSFFAFMISGIMYWFLFSGLLLLYAITEDFTKVDRSFEHTLQSPRVVVDASQTILSAVFRCTILGIFIATTIKLNGAYIVSDAPNIFRWLVDDGVVVLGISEQGWSWIGNKPSPFFTSFVLVLLLCFVFLLCLFKLSAAVRNLRIDIDERRRWNTARSKMLGVLAVAVSGYLAIGQFYGFSIVLMATTIVGLAGTFVQSHQRTSDANPSTESKNG